MRSDARLIDLGLIDLGRADPDAAAPLDEADNPKARPASGWRPRSWSAARAPIPARLWHWWPLVLLTVALLASTAAAAPSPHGLAPVFSLPVDWRTAVALTDQSLYVVTGAPVSATVPDPQFSVSAYALRDGRPRWTVAHDVTDRPSAATVTVVGGVPLVTGWRIYRLEARPDVDMEGLTTAYDPATGEPRWTRPGFLVAHHDGEVVLEQIEYAGTPAVAVAYHVTGVDIASGDLHWRYDVRLSRHSLLLGRDSRTDADRDDLPVTDVWALSDDGHRLATLRRDGRLVVRHLPTGEEAQQDLGRPWHDASLAIGDGLLRVSTLLNRERTLVVYDLQTLTERWRLSGMPVTANLEPCGPVLCLRTRDQLQGLDPATGAGRWDADPGWAMPTPLGPPWPPGYLQVVPDHDRIDEETDGALAAAVLDAATGAPVLTLADWRPYPGPHHHPYPIVRQRGEGAHMPGHPQYDPGPLWLGRVAPDRGEVEVLGVLDHVRDCQVGERYLACVSTEQQVTVWRIR